MLHGMRPQLADVALLVLSTAAGLVVVEGALRGFGLGPWTEFRSFEHVPTLTQADPTLGWVNRPGQYSYAAADGSPVQVSVAPTGARGADVGATWLMGCSFVYGFGLSDEDVVSAQLARLRPDVRPVNHAVPGYGTVQSAMLWQRSGSPGQTIVYGLTELHDGRNVAANTWLHALDRAGPSHDWTGVPSAVWDGVALQRSPPRRYAHWPLSELLAVVDLTERASLRVRDRFLRTKSETTIQVIREWSDAVGEAGGELVVALLHAPSRERHYTRRLDEEGVRWLDLRSPRFPEATLPDGHPDASLHAGWAAALAEAL